MTSTSVAIAIPARTFGRQQPRSGEPHRALLTRHSLRVALGVLWLLDGALQLQSFMFTTGFAKTIIAPAASGQPFFVAGPVEWNARLIAAHPSLADGLFASIQLALGLALLFRRTAKAAIVASVAWAAGVWYFGEGLGGLASGHVTALSGAPGAAILYAVIAVAAWPVSRGPAWSEDRQRSARPPHWTCTVWAILWVGFAILSILPPNVSPASVSRQLSENASMMPTWLGSVARISAGAVHDWGSGAIVSMAAVELAIGLFALRSGRLQRVALWAGIAVALSYWAVGQDFGQLFSGQATDPNAGPLLVLLGLASLGATRSTRRSSLLALEADPMSTSPAEMAA